MLTSGFVQRVFLPDSENSENSDCNAHIVTMRQPAYNPPLAGATEIAEDDNLKKQVGTYRRERAGFFWKSSSGNCWSWFRFSRLAWETHTVIRGIRMFYETFY